MGKYDTWTLKELRNELASRHARLSGRKMDLITRLESYDRNHNFGNEISTNEKYEMMLPDPKLYRDVTGKASISTVSSTVLLWTFTSKISVTLCQEGKSFMNQIAMDMQDPTSQGTCDSQTVSHGSSPFLCVVCGDTASGYHYGVPACEGCKAFFKRSLQAADLNYRCPGNNNCKIDKMSRKCCQACRLRKCHEVGMSKEFLGNKKIKKNSKGDGGKNHKASKKLKQMSTDDEDLKCAEPTSTQDAELESVVKALVTLENETKELRVSQPDGTDVMTTGYLCKQIGRQLVAVIDWAKGLPGYDTLTLNDQAILLQAGWIELLLLNWVFLSIERINKVAFSSDVVVDDRTSRTLGLDSVYSQLLPLVTRVRSYELDEEEFVCLKAIGLMNADSCGLSGSRGVQELVRKYSMALAYHISTYHPDKPQKFAKIVLILPQLKYVVNHVIEFLYRVKLSGEAQLSDLLVEMLEAKSRL